LQQSKLAKRAALLFILAIITFYLYGLGRLPLLGPDEPRYAEVAREMYERGDMVTPTLGGHTWFEKPALLYWMMMAGYKVFGVSEFSARLGPALCGLLTAILIYWLGKRVERAGEVFNETVRAEHWPSLAFASSLGAIVFSRAASFDIVVTMTITLALVCFFIAELETEEKKRSWLIAGFYGAVGLSLLAKGLIGIVIPFGVIGLYYLMRRQWPDRKILFSVLWGVPLALAVSATWYAPVIARHGWVFIDQFFIQHHFARFVSNKYHHPGPFYFYIPVMLMMALPWTAFLIAEIGALRKSTWLEESLTNRFRLFALAWLLVPLLFFSFSGSKLPAYILPALPGAAMLVGMRLSHFIKDETSSIAMRATGVLLMVQAAATIILSTRTNLITLACAMLSAAPLVLAGVFAIVWKNSRSLKIELITSAIFISIALTLNCAAGPIAGRESVRDLLRNAEARGYVSTPIFYMLDDDRTAEFYAGGRLGYRDDGEPYRFDGAHEVADAARQTGGTALVLIPTEWENKLTDYSAIETEIIGRSGAQTLALIRVR